MKQFKEKLGKIPWKVLFLTLLIFFIIPMPDRGCSLFDCGEGVLIGFYVFPYIFSLILGGAQNLIPALISIVISFFIAKLLYGAFKNKRKYFNLLIILLLTIEIFDFFIYNPMLPLEDNKVSKIMELTYNNPIEDSHICDEIKIPSKRIGYPDSDYYIESISHGKKVCFDRTYGNKLASIKKSLNYSACEDFGNIIWEEVYLKSKCYSELAPLILNETLCNNKYSENEELNNELNKSCFYYARKSISGGIYVDGFITPVDSLTKVGIITITDSDVSHYWRPYLEYMNNSEGYFRFDSLPSNNPEIYVERQGVIYRRNYTCVIKEYNFNCHFLINLSNAYNYKNRNLILYSKTKYSDQEILQDDTTNSIIISRGFDADENLYWYEIEYDSSLLNIPIRGNGSMSLYLYYDKFANRYPGLRLKIEKGKPVYLGQSPPYEVNLW